MIVMNKYHRGDYHIKFFDDFGDHLGNDMNAGGFIIAEQIAKEIMCEEAEVHSYVIIHILQNSLTSMGTW